MSVQTLPTLKGIAFPVTRTALWDTDVQKAISGNEVRLAYFTYPLYSWEADFNVLQSSAAVADFQTLIGFYNARQGSFDSFLYQDPDDYAVISQSIGTGNGTQTSFQLIKTLGGYIEPVLAPNLYGPVFNVYLNGVLQTGGGAYSVSAWGTGTPGMLTFASAPGNGVVITADFHYYYPCRFSNDSVGFSLSYYQIYKVSKLKWQSVRN